MTQPQARSTSLTVWTAITVVTFLLLMTAAAARAETFTVLHTLNGGSEGAGEVNGLVMDRAGNLYGTAYTGGISNCPATPSGCGTVFKLSRKGTGWVFSVLYSFTGVADGWWPLTIAIGPDGSLYGTTLFGGFDDCEPGWGCGTVFRLQPPATFCRSVSCPWIKTTLVEFIPVPYGVEPSQTVTFDQAGNLYGATGRGGSNDGGTIWELAHSNGSWNYNVLYNQQTLTGETGLGVTFDAAGNLWGVGYGGNNQNCNDPQQPEYCGVVWQLTPSGSGWNQNIVYNFNDSTGGLPSSNLIVDQAGNMYGTVSDNGPGGNGGVFRYDPVSGQYDMIYAAPGNKNSAYGPTGTPVMDQAGNLYAADPYNGANHNGYVFKLTPVDGNWIYADLHDFTGGSDGGDPYGPLAVDASGNVYGTAGNVIFEITP